MKKGFTHTLIWSLTTLFPMIGLSSCVKENLNDCPDDIEYNLILHFEYFDHEGNDIFVERLERIDALLYDETNQLYRWVDCDEVIASEDRLIRLWVDPGTYTVIGWANNFSHRDMFQTYSETDLLETNLPHDNEQTADPLHYAPDLRLLNAKASKADANENNKNLDAYTVTVQRTQVSEHTLSFMSAHRTVNVYLKGFGAISNPDLENPLVSIRNLTSWYDSFLGRGEENAAFQSTAREIIMDDEIYGLASFYVPHFNNDNNITIIIYTRDSTGGNHTYYVSMTEVLEARELEVEDGDDAVIDILVELKDLYVEISVPSWDQKDVDWKK